MAKARLIRAARRLRSPGWMVFFAAMLGLSYWGLVRHVRRTVGIHSAIGQRVGADFLIRMNDPAGLWYAVKDPDLGAWRVVVDRQFSAGAVAAEIARDPASVVLLDWRDLDGADGLYDPVKLVEGRELVLMRADGRPLAAEEIPRLFHDLATSDVRGLVDPAYDVAPWEISAGRAVQRRGTIYWPAVANNAIAAVGAAGLLWSLGWIPAALARRRRAARHGRGHCPWCAYDRRASGAGPCPECGSPFLVDREDD